MAYPKYKTIKKKFLWWDYKSEQEDGWEDTGHAGNDEMDIICDFCGGDLRVGREKDKSFIYCPRCFSIKFVKNK